MKNVQQIVLSPVDEQEWGWGSSYRTKGCITGRPSLYNQLARMATAKLQHKHSGH